MTSPEFFAQVELLFGQLLDALTSFSVAEQGEVKRFVDVGEYGLAVETASDIILDEGKPLSRASYELLERLVTMMEIGDTVDLSRVAEHVVELG
jgi:hypothetical protein